MAKRIAFKVEGNVQGVNFRSFTAKTAKQLGLTGYVKNHAAGHVEGEAQGDEGKLQEFVKLLHEGPSAASVEKVEQSNIEVREGDHGFPARD